MSHREVRPSGRMRRSVRLGSGASALLLVGSAMLVATPARATSQSPVVGSKGTLYAGDLLDSLVWPFDVATQRFGPPIDTGFAAPSFVAVTPDHKALYFGAGGNGAAMQVRPYAIKTATLGSAVTFQGQGTFGVGQLAVSPDGKTLYLSQNDGIEVSIHRVNIVTNAALPDIPIPQAVLNSSSYCCGPDWIVVSPDGQTLYTLWGGNTIWAVNVATGGFTPLNLNVPQSPLAAALSPDGSTLWVLTNTGDCCGTVLATNQSGGFLVPVSTASFTAGTPIPIPATIGANPNIDPSSLALSTDGTKAWVAEKSDGLVIPVDLVGGSPGTPIPIAAPAGGSPVILTFVGLAPDGTTLEALDGDNDAVTSINTSTGAVGTPVGFNDPNGLGAPLSFAEVPPGHVGPSPHG